MSNDFEPRILAFLCNWCSYAGADLAGVSRVQYPPNMRSIRVMCTGRIDPEFIIEGFKKGLDGILISGCHPGDCHYLTGNYEAKRRVEAMKKLLALTGLRPERLRLEWVSASEGRLFGEVTTEFIEQIRALGPSPLTDPSKREKLLLDLDAALEVVTGFKFRGFVGKEGELTAKGNAYGELLPEGDFEELMDEAIEDEFLCGSILVLTRDKDASVMEMAEKIGTEPGRVLRYVSKLRKRNLIGLSRIEGTTPRYINISVPEGR